jgi:hypothetical protein
MASGWGDGRRREGWEEEDRQGEDGTVDPRL